MTQTPSRLAALALLLGALPASVPAMAQQIAPSRQYGGKSDTPSGQYAPPAASTLEKHYGLPTFGRPEAAVPPHRTLATPPKEPEDASLEFLPPETREDPLKAMLATPANQGDPADFFAPDNGGAPLPSQAKRGGLSDTTETPLFTSGEQAAAAAGSAMNLRTADKPDPLFTTGPATTSFSGSTLDAEPAAKPGPGTAKR